MSATLTTSAAPASVLLLNFTLSGSTRSGFRVQAVRDEGWVSDGMFSVYEHSHSFPTKEAAQPLLDRILSGAHYCPRYNSKGRACNLAHWVCINGAFKR